MSERDINDRIDRVLDRGAEFVADGIIELLEDAQLEIVSLRREINRLKREKAA